jgi:hypothetical protein
MRTILTLGMLIIFCVSADATPLRHSRPIKRRPRPEHAITAPDARKSYTVPGWTDEETQKWLDDATRMVGRGA